jgi:hypothetical protein
MRRPLTIHPDTVCPAIASIEVDISRPRPDLLVLDYRLIGDLGDLSLPPATTPRRADGLWRRTCFEAFVRAAPGQDYVEFNLSPSRAWAAYRFSGYRADMSVADGIAQPSIDVQSSGRRFELRAGFDLAGLPGWHSDAAWRLGVSAVIEAANGDTSYWALAHPPGKPDFHHPDGFAIELPWMEPS